MPFFLGILFIQNAVFFSNEPRAGEAILAFETMHRIFHISALYHVVTKADFITAILCKRRKIAKLALETGKRIETISRVVSAQEIAAIFRQFQHKTVGAVFAFFDLIAKAIFALLFECGSPPYFGLEYVIKRTAGTIIMRARRKVVFCAFQFVLFFRILRIHNAILFVAQIPAEKAIREVAAIE